MATRSPIQLAIGKLKVPKARDYVRVDILLPPEIHKQLIIASQDAFGQPKKGMITAMFVEAITAYLAEHTSTGTWAVCLPLGEVE